MSVAHHGLRRADHAAAALQPTRAQVAILRGKGKAGRVEPAQGAQALRGRGQVVAGEKARVIGVSVIVSIDGVEQRLAGGGVGVGRQRVERASAEQAAGALHLPRGQGAQPAGVGQAVVVGKGQQLAARGGDAGIARGSGAAMRRGQQRHSHPAAHRREDCFQRQAAAIVHHQHLVALVRVIQRCQRAQTLGQTIGASVGRDNDGDVH